MTDDRERLDWKVPAKEWDRFENHVSAEYGTYKGELSRRVEDAMREYAGTDGELEAVENTLRAALGGPAEERRRNLTGEPSSVEGETVEGVEPLANQERERKQPRVDPDVVAAFRERADDADDPYGVELARALRQYRLKPRDERLLSLAETIAAEGDDFEGPLQTGGCDDPIDQDGDTDGPSADDAAENKTDLTSRERRAGELVARLRETGDDQLYVENDIRPAIAATEGISDDPDPQTVRDYADEVSERMGLVEHPMNPDLRVPPEDVPERPDHVPAECWVSVDVLEPPTRARRICLELGRRAANKSTGTEGLLIEEIHEEILDEEVSKRTVRGDVKRAAERPGFRTTSTEGGLTALRVDLEIVTDQDLELFKEIVAYRDGEKPKDDADAVETDSEPEPTPEPEPEPEVETETEDLSPIEQVAANFTGKRGCLQDMGISIVRTSLAEAMEIEPAAVEDDNLREVIEIAGLSDLFADELAALENSAERLDELTEGVPTADGGSHQPQTHTAEPIIVEVEAE